MKKMNIVASQPIEIEGEVIAGGDVLGTIESSYSPDELQSLFAARVLQVVAVSSIPPKPQQPVEQSDNLDAAEGDDDVIDSPTPTPAKPNPLPNSDEQLQEFCDQEFPGLKHKIAALLVGAGINSPEDFRAKVDAGYNIEDIDMLGPKLKKEAIAWLDKTIPPKT